MHKFVVTSLLLALFISTSAFTSTNTSGKSQTSHQFAKKALLNINAIHTGPGKLTSTWNSDWNGNFNVYLIDAVTMQLVQFNVTANPFIIYNNLASGTYRVSVTDQNSTILSAVVAVK